MESFISLGRLHIPIFGIFAAIGLMCSLALGLRTAVLARVDRDAFWDLCFVSIISAFLLSRTVLILENLTTFIRYPLAVLELPFITSSGVFATLLLSWYYMRRRKLPVLGTFDAAAPCVALQLAFLSAGLWFDGTREGMPSTLPWAVGSSFGRVHPVELYAVAAWSIVCGLLLLLLARRPVRGEIAGFGLVLAGLVIALLGFFRLPELLYGTQTLDSSQWRGIKMIVAGGLLLAWRYAVAGRSPATAAPREVSRAV